MSIKKYDVVVIGELNVDLILNKTDVFPELGKEILARQMNLVLGSSSAIFASNISCLGVRVAFIGKTGVDLFGDFVISSLQSKAVDTGGIVQSRSCSTGATVVINVNEDRAMITHPGAMETFSGNEVNWDIIRQSRHLHISSYFIQTSLQKNIGDIFRKAKQMGLTTSFDPQWDPAEKWEIDLDRMLPDIDLFFPNESEILKITQTSTIKDALQKIKPAGTAIVIKQGNQGSTIIQNSKAHSLPALLNEEVVDAIGAGDSFNAGFVYRFLQNQPLEYCHRFGNMIAAMSTTAAGGTGAFSGRQEVFTVLKEKYGYEEN